MRIYYFIVLLCFIILPACLFAQADLHFSQFYETSILRNPAVVGVFTDNFKVSSLARSQWSSITNPYQTAMIDGEYRTAIGDVSNDFLSIGLLAYYDQAGDLNQKISGVYPALNYNKSIDADYNCYLSLGVTLGYLQYSFDPSKATFNNQFQNGIFSPNNPSYDHLPTPHLSVYDLGTGINFNISPNRNNDFTFMVGVAAYHVNQPVFSYYNTLTHTQNIRFNVNSAIIKELNESWIFQLHSNFSNQGTYNEFLLGGLVGWHQPFENLGFEMLAGVLYRLKDAVTPVIKLKYRNVGLGISYDVNTSTLVEASQTQGGYEITLSISGNLPKSRQQQLLKKTVCPRF